MSAMERQISRVVKALPAEATAILSHLAAYGQRASGSSRGLARPYAEARSNILLAHDLIRKGSHFRIML
jgi:hypothetical protein